MLLTTYATLGIVAVCFALIAAWIVTGHEKRLAERRDDADI